MLERVEELSLHPLGRHCVRGKHEHEPVAALERLADFVVSLLGALDVRLAVPDPCIVPAENRDEPADERAVLSSLGKDQPTALPTHGEALNEPLAR